MRIPIAFSLLLFTSVVWGQLPQVGTTRSGTIYDINAITGAASNPRGSFIQANQALVDLERNSTNGLYYALTSGISGTSGFLQTVNPATGSSVSSVALSFAIIEGDIAFDPTVPSANPYVLAPLAGSSASALFRINASTGASTNIATYTSAQMVDPSGLAFTSTGDLYAVALGGGGVADERLLRLNKLDGSITSNVALNTTGAGLGTFAGFTIDPTTNRLFLLTDNGAGSDALFEVNPATGGLTTLGQSGFTSFAGLTTLAVPEPATLALAGLVLLGTGHFVWRRRVQRQTLLKANVEPLSMMEE